MQINKIYWTEDAAIDLEEIIDYIFQDRESVAVKIYNEIKQVTASLKTTAKRNRIVPELQNIGITNYREIIYKCYRIIYKLDIKNIYIIAVIDSRRDFETLIFQRLLRK
mgnify:CR=1 FL=1